MMGEWTFLSNYGHVLVCLARNHDARLRDVAEQVGLTERAVQKIVRDLQQADYLSVSKRGRCNRYRINRRKALRHALESHCTVGKLLALVAGSASGDRQIAAEEPEANGVEAVRVEAAVSEPAQAEKDPKTETTKAGDKKKKPPLDTREQGSLF